MKIVSGEGKKRNFGRSGGGRDPKVGQTEKLAQNIEKLFLVNLTRWLVLAKLGLAKVGVGQTWAAEVVCATVLNRRQSAPLA